MSKAEMDTRGWKELDFLFITGDAYVDHPSFGVAIISRVLENAGFRVGIVAQPDWHSTDDFLALGRPRLAALVTGGNLDSMVSNYTAAKRPRREDEYSPGGIGGKRPDRASVVYSNRVREAFPGIPIILGGIEASLRRFAHYDWWQDKVRRSILLDAKADVLVFGMGELQIVELANLLDKHPDDWRDHLPEVRGICYASSTLDEGVKAMPSYEDVVADKKVYAEAYLAQHLEEDPINGRGLAQDHGGRYVVQNRPARPLTTPELDSVYALPYTRRYHPRYEEAGGVPALIEVEFSIVSHRGCYGACSFCAIAAHQGRVIQHRSLQSILAEARLLTALPNFKGYIHDLGGPTADFYEPACEKQEKMGACRGKQCLSPEACKNLRVDHTEYLNALRTVRNLPGVKKVFVRSGLRYDYLLLDENDTFLRELCKYHISGQLKVAPEHVSRSVTRLMGKPSGDVYTRFADKYARINRELGKKQYLVPYFMSSHPGATINDAVELAEFIHGMGFRPEQVQDFMPTPGSLSTCMYYTGINPLTGEQVYVARTDHEKALQRALLQYWRPENRELVLEALRLAHRMDLVGIGPKALIPPRVFKSGGRPHESGSDYRSTEARPERRSDNRDRRPTGKI
jgi:uncharacterized radical SAM protein YgiQ